MTLAIPNEAYRIPIRLEGAEGPPVNELVPKYQQTANKISIHARNSYVHVLVEGFDPNCLLS